MISNKRKKKKNDSDFREIRFGFKTYTAIELIVFVLPYRNSGQKNFHVFYDFLDAATADQVLERYHLEEGRRYRYLLGDDSDDRVQSKTNVKNFNKLLACMKDTLEFTDEHLNTVWRVLAAILNVGELSVFEEDDGEAKIEDNGLVTKS